MGIVCQREVSYVRVYRIRYCSIGKSVVLADRVSVACTVHTIKVQEWAFIP